MIDFQKRLVIIIPDFYTIVFPAIGNKPYRSPGCFAAATKAKSPANPINVAS